MASEQISVALYERYSSEMQRDGYSIAFQDNICRAWCDANERTVVEVYRDEAKNASTSERPEFQRMLRDVNRHIWKEIVFYDLSRFTRNIEDAALIGQIERKGIRLVSATQRFDTTDPSGALTRNVSLVIDDYYLRKLRQVTTAGKVTRAKGDERRGVVARSNASQPPFGYSRIIKAVDDRAYRDDLPNEQATWATSAFERYAEGLHSDLDIARWLNRNGIKTTRGAPFSKDTVRVMLMNRYYAGWVAYRGMSAEWTAGGKRKRNPRNQTQWTRGSHKAIISDELFERCQEVRRESSHRQAGRKPSEVHIYLLNGLAVCSKCDKKLGCSMVNSDTKESYRCKSYERGIECTSRKHHVRQEVLQPYIDRMIEQLRVPDEVIDTAIELSQAPETLSNTEKRQNDLKTELTRLNRMYQRGAVANAYYDTELARIQAEITALAPVAPVEIEQAAEEIAGLADAWKNLDAQGRHDVLHTLLESVVIDIEKGAVVKWNPRREFAAIFAAVEI